MSRVTTAERMSVYVENTGSATFNDAYDGVHYTIPPGQKAIVPLVAAKLWFGDWDSGDDPRKGGTRKEEINRLYVRYGVILDEVTKGGPPSRPEDVIWEERRPHVRVYTLDQDEIATVIDDPTGTKVIAHVETVSDRDELMHLIRQTQADLSAMKKEYAKESRAAASVAAGSDVEEDVVETPPSKRSRANRPAEV